VGYGSVYDAAWRPDDAVFAIASDTGVRLYTLELTEILTIPEQNPPPSGVTMRGTISAMSFPYDYNLVSTINDDLEGTVANWVNIASPDVDILAPDIQEYYNNVYDPNQQAGGAMLIGHTIVAVATQNGLDSTSILDSTTQQVIDELVNSYGFSLNPSEEQALRDVLLAFTPTNRNADEIINAIDAYINER
jgi:hypothetical protein